MTWHKPKKVITNTLVIFSLLSLVVTIVAIVTTFIWLKSPKLVNKIDIKIPSFYVNDICSLYEKAKKAKNIDIQYKYYKKLNIALDGISSLDRFYKTKQKTYKFLIHYYRSKNENQNALNIAKDWMLQNDYDYAAKLYYVDTLAVISKKLASKYYYELYNRHKDISEIAKQYISFLLKNKQLDKALIIENEFNINNTNSINARFKLYYLDKNNPKYSEKASLNISILRKSKNNSVKLLVSEEFNFLSGVRFDINNVPLGSTIENLIIDIATEDNTYKNITFNPKHHIKKLNVSLYETIGNDPFYYLDLPTELQSYKGNIKFMISLALNNQINIAKNAISNITQVDK